MASSIPETGTEPASVATANNTPIYTHSWGKAIRHAANGDHIHRTMCGDWLARAEIAVHNLRMNSGEYKYIWQASDWPNWRFDLAALAELMAEVSRAEQVKIVVA